MKLFKNLLSRGLWGIYGKPICRWWLGAEMEERAYVISKWYFIAIICLATITLKLPELIIFGKLNEWGDFLAGLFGPMAFAWLIVGYNLQRVELQRNTNALKSQADELKNTLIQHKKMVELETKSLYATFLPMLIFKDSEKVEFSDGSYRFDIFFQNAGGAALGAKFLNVRAGYNTYSGPDTKKNLKFLHVITPVMSGEAVVYSVLCKDGGHPEIVWLEVTLPTTLGRDQRTDFELVYSSDHEGYYCQSQKSSLV